MMDISLDDYLMGRDKEYPPTQEMLDDANTLLLRVEALFYELGIEIKKEDLSSGYRPGKYNVAAGGSKNSCHLKCVAIDLGESEKRELTSKMTEDLLKKHDLYMEAPLSTIKVKENGKKVYWLHLQTRATRRRIFFP